ncbi:MAG: DMT family transporter [Planctomycetota bacterium]
MPQQERGGFVQGTGPVPDPGTSAEPRARDARREGLWALVAVQLLFGMFPVTGKLAFASFAPEALAGWRIAVGSAVLLTAAFLRHGRRAVPRWRDLLAIQGLSILGVLCNQVLFVLGLARSRATDAGVVMALIPVFTFVAAIALRQERFRAGRGLGVAVALAGFVLLLDTGTGGRGLGNLLMAANALSYSLYLVLSKPMTRRYPPLVLMAWVYALSLWAVPLFAAGVDPWPDPGPAALWSFVYVLLGPTVLAYFLNLYALARLPASTTAAFVYLQPFIAGLGGLLVLGERPEAGFLRAAGLVLVGLGLVLRR